MSGASRKALPNEDEDISQCRLEHIGADDKRVVEEGTH
jgi:hypothetical protein